MSAISAKTLLPPVLQLSRTSGSASEGSLSNTPRFLASGSEGFGGGLRPRSACAPQALIGQSSAEGYKGAEQQVMSADVSANYGQEGRLVVGCPRPLPSPTGTSGPGRHGLQGRQRHRKHRQRRRQQTEAENDLFTSFTLNRDPENSKYLPYDEVIYPKLFNRPDETRRTHLEVGASAFERPRGGKSASGRLSMTAAAELDSMWVVGFIEDARRNQKGILLKELRGFVGLPGSNVLPGAHLALDTINQIEQPTSFNSQKEAGHVGGYRANCAEGVVHHGGSDRVRSDVPDDTNGVEASGGKSALTPLERLRLRELEERLTQARRGVLKDSIRRRAGVRIYATANRKLGKILKGARPPAAGPVFQSEGLESVFRRNREEWAAAVRIQRVYKQHYRREKFSKMTRQLRGVVLIQAVARGVLARRYVAEWYSQRSVMVLAWQSVIRRMLSNIKWQRRVQVEHQAAATMQAAARARAGRKLARRTQINLAAVRIQCLWRGARDRVRVDRLYLGILATRIQGLARVMVAKRTVGRKRRICNDAARTIQRCFRGNVARVAMGKLIWERGMARRLDFLRALAAEEDWERENMEITQRRSRRMRLEEKLKEALADEEATHSAVFQLESNEQELKTQRLMLSPRALQQGWKEELNSNIEQHRGWITQRKLDAVFKGSFPARQLEEQMKRRDDQLSERRKQATRLARWRDAEMRGLLDRQSRRHFDDQHLARRRKIADEKRKWAVKHVTLSGKPDKLKARRRSRPWEAFADPAERVLKQVFTGGNVDLFANERSPQEALTQLRATLKNSGHAATCSGVLSKSGTLEQIMARLGLQTHVNQVAQFDEVMRPAQEVINTLGLDPLLETDRAPVVAHDGASTPRRKDYRESPPLSTGSPRAPPPSPLPRPPTSGDKISKREEANLAAVTVEHKQQQAPIAPVSEEPNPSSNNAARFARQHSSAAGFVDRYGAAASIPPGRPPTVGSGGTPVPIEFDEEARVVARQRQRRLHMLAMEDASTMPAAGRKEMGQGLRPSASRVPWHLLDELDAEKQKLSVRRRVSARRMQA